MLYESMVKPRILINSNHQITSYISIAFRGVSSDNEAMIQIRGKKVALASLYGVNLDGQVVWRSTKVGKPNRCLATSAISVITRQFAAHSDLSIDKIDALLDRLEQAYSSRIPESDYYFNQEALRQLGFWETWLLSAPLKKDPAPLDHIFTWIHNRGTSRFGWTTPSRFQNMGFILMLQRPNEKQQHAISIHCKELWIKGGGFGIEDTQYIDQKPVRKVIHCATKELFYKKLSDYIAEWSYKDATIQPILLEPMYTMRPNPFEPTITKATNLTEQPLIPTGTSRRPLLDRVKSTTTLLMSGRYVMHR